MLEVYCHPSVTAHCHTHPHAHTYTQTHRHKHTLRSPVRKHVPSHVRTHAHSTHTHHTPTFAHTYHTHTHTHTHTLSPEHQNKPNTVAAGEMDYTLTLLSLVLLDRRARWKQTRPIQARCRFCNGEDVFAVICMQSVAKIDR